MIPPTLQTCSSCELLLLQNITQTLSSVRFRCNHCHHFLCDEHTTIHQKIFPTHITISIHHPIQPLLQKASNTNTVLQDALHRIHQTLHTLNYNSQQTRQHIEAHFGKLSEALERRRQQLVDQLELMTEAAASNIRRQEEEVKVLLDDLDQHVGRVHYGLEEKSSMEVNVLDDLMKSIEKKVSFFNQTPQPCRILFYSELTFEVEAIQKIGNLFEEGISPQYSAVVGDEFWCDKVQLDGFFEVTLGDSRGNPVGEVKMEHLEARLIGASGKCDMEIVERQGGCKGVCRYSLSHAPSGDNFQIQVSIRDSPIQHSPITIKIVKRVQGKLLQTWELRECGDGYLSGPWDICAAGDEVFVSDRGKHCVRVYDRSGRQVRCWGSTESGFGELTLPHGICVYGNEVYVSDCENHRVCVFDKNGAWRRSIGSVGDGDGKLLGPNGLCVWNDMVFVSELGNCRVSVFDLQGRFLRHLIGERHLGNPQFLCVSARGEVYISDWQNHRIIVMTIYGKTIRQWGTEGTGDGQLMHPMGIQIVGDQVVVAEYGNRRVQVFDHYGRFIKYCYSGGANFNKPRGVSVYSEGILICDGGSNLIHLFE